MSLDGIAINALTRELAETLPGSKIDKIGQSDAHTLNLTLRKPGENIKLVCSIHPQSARLCVTERPYTNLPEPPIFCMVLRKHLLNAVIIEVQQMDWERMIVLSCQGRSEIGEPTELRLICELMGKTSNILLVDAAGTILDAMRRVGAHTNTYRQIQPGIAYVMPPAQDKTPLEALTLSDLSGAILAAPETRSLQKTLLQTIAGLGPQTVREILVRAKLDPEAKNEFLGEVDFIRLYQSVQELLERIEKGNWTPTQVMEEGCPIAFAPFSLQQFASLTQISFPSMSALLETFFHSREQAAKLQQKRTALARILRHELERCEKKLGHQMDTVYAAEAADTYRLYGELLTAHLYQIKQGNEAIVTNFYDPEQKPVTIPMQAEKTPNENAQRYFARYNKAQKGAVLAQAQAERTQAEMSYLHSIQAGLEQAEDFEDLNEIRREMEEAGYVKRQALRRKKARDPAPQPLHVSYERYDIFIGKNNRQNDYVTFKIGRNSDLWLHTKDIHGAHVIVKGRGEADWPESVVEVAAQLAAWFSKGRQSTNVPVDVTLRKNVHKPTGAPAGKVIYTDQRTLFVTASEEDISTLLSEEH